MALDTGLNSIPLRAVKDIIDIRAAEIFLAVCDTGGVSAAAATLGISQAAVSQRLNQLERELGTALFNRQTRPLQLLPAGIALRDRGRSLVHDWRDLSAALKRFQDVDLPELRIGIIESIAPALVPRLVPELRKMVGTLSLLSGLIGPLVPEVQAGKLDIMVTSERLDEVDGLECHTLIREPFVLLLPKGAKPPERLRDIIDLSQQFTFARYGPRRRMSALIDRQLARFGVELPRTLEFASSAPIIDLVRQDIAWTILTPLCLYSARVPVGELTVVPIPSMSFSRKVELAAPEARFGDIPARIATFCRRIIDEDVIPQLKAHAPFAADLMMSRDPL